MQNRYDDLHATPVAAHQSKPTMNPLQTNFDSQPEGAPWRRYSLPSARSSKDSLVLSDRSSEIIEQPNTPTTELNVDEDQDKVSGLPIATVEYQDGKPRRASTSLISQEGDDLRKLLGDGETGTKLLQKFCCGGGCCLAKPLEELSIIKIKTAPADVPLPDNDAFRSLNLNLSGLELDTELTSIIPLPETTVVIEAIQSSTKYKAPASTLGKPPAFMQPHPPYHVYSAPVFNARELTKPGAEKRTIHFDIDVTDYPSEGGVDFKVGGAIGVCPPNDDEMVEDIFERLGVPRFLRDKPITLKTSTGRWPTIWGDDEAREITTTRRELLTWCADIQSTPPTKTLLRLLAEHTSNPVEKRVLTYLTSSEGQGAFCDLRTGPYITLPQLLHAFPSSQPPLDHLFSCLKQLMPRFYSLSNDPHVSSQREGLSGRRLIEMAVTIHELPNWKNNTRTGVGSGYLERVAMEFIAAKEKYPDATPNFHIPIFRGLMANPLSREFISDGPMLLIGAGVGMAPFRGFILNRLKNANCANKIWLLQGVRDSSFDELYKGELGSEESKIKKIVQSRKVDRHVGEAKYVQEEVVQQADIVWFVVNAVDGRVFVCGSSAGMGEGVHEALISVAMDKGGLDREQAEAFWTMKSEGGQYIAVSEASTSYY
jgi:sulfite reductase alpha subunit-like flavoprotein